MDRMACVDLPGFPLQLLLGKHPDWRDAPVAVVDQDKPQGTILWVNERARVGRILPGMRYAAGLSLAAGLRAAVVPEADVARAVTALTRRLRSFTPHVEPATAEGEHGVFWLDASGLERLYDSLGRWGRGIHDELKRIGFVSTVVVGFHRFGSYALAKAGRGVRVLERPEDELTAARGVPLERLAVAPKTRDTLARLGITTVGGFVALPREGIEKRFGREALRLHALASGELRLPLQPERSLPPALERFLLDQPETSVPRLMVVIEQLLEPLLATMAERGQRLEEIRVGFRFERLGDHLEKVRPAAPTRDPVQLLELIRLRLESIRRLPDGVAEVVLVGRGARIAPGQQSLFDEKPRRDVVAADRALARVRAELGDDAVVQATLRQGHLPEGSFTWEKLDALVAAAPRREARGRLVRRIHLRPLPLPPRPRQEPDGWMPHGLTRGPVIRVLGPYVVSGGWWNRAVHREYHFAETQKGELLWVFYDRVRRRWFLQGRVE